MDFSALLTQCAPNVAPQTMAAVVSVESSYNPYAIGVVGGALRHQPQTLEEALAAVQALVDKGRNFSMGLAQVNRHNLPKHGVSYKQIFDPCTNIKVGAAILTECYARAVPRFGDEQKALQAALSCYYSGNFKRGFRPDKAGELSYVQKVVAASGHKTPNVVVVPAIAAAAYERPQPVAKPETPNPLVWNNPVLMGQVGVDDHAANIHPDASALLAQAQAAQTAAIEAIQAAKPPAPTGDGERVAIKGPSAVVF